jgi:hypothetical protein
VGVPGSCSPGYGGQKRRARVQPSMDMDMERVWGSVNAQSWYDSSIRINKMSFQLTFIPIPVLTPDVLTSYRPSPL